MPITKNLVKEDLSQYVTPGTSPISLKGFEAEKSDDNYFSNPYYPVQPIVSKYVSIDVSEDIKVEFSDGLVSIIPAGVLEVGVRHRFDIVKLFDTGTGASVRMFVWI